MRVSPVLLTSVLLALAGTGLAGCSAGGQVEKVATAVTTETTTVPQTAGPDSSDNADSADDASFPLDGDVVDGTQVVDLAPTDLDLTLEVPEGWRWSDTAADVPYFTFVAVSPEPVGGFGTNIFVTVEPVGAGVSADDVFRVHDADLLGYRSNIPDGTPTTIGGYPAHVLSGAMTGPSGQALAQSSTLVFVEDDDGTAVILAVALTAHEDDSDGRTVLGTLLGDATID